MTEKEKMLAGEVYSAVDPELIEELMATREVLYEYNSLRPSEIQRMKEHQPAVSLRLWQTDKHRQAILC